jgi:hypothetical protein
LITARLVLHKYGGKYGGRKATNSEDEDASAFAEASFAKIWNKRIHQDVRI